MGFPHIIRQNGPSHRFFEIASITGDKEIEPAIVVVVEKPAWKALLGFSNACSLGDIGENPTFSLRIGTVIA